MVSGPERQCIGCGRRGPVDGFLRLSLDKTVEPARVVVERTREAKGRGAYLCRRIACLDRACHRKAFQRAFRATVAVDAGEIAAVLTAETGD